MVDVFINELKLIPILDLSFRYPGACSWVFLLGKWGMGNENGEWEIGNGIGETGNGGRSCGKRMKRWRSQILFETAKQAKLQIRLSNRIGKVGT